MMTDEISEFLEKMDAEHFNCVYSCNGMTLLRSEEYDNRMKQIEELRHERNKYRNREEGLKSGIKINVSRVFTPFTDPEHPEIRKTFIVSKKGVEEYIKWIYEVDAAEEKTDVIWIDN